MINDLLPWSALKWDVVLTRINDLLRRKKTEWSQAGQIKRRIVKIDNWKLNPSAKALRWKETLTICLQRWKSQESDNPNDGLDGS